MSTRHGIVLLWLLAACSPAAAQPAEEAPRSDVSLRSPHVYEGLVVATQATELRAPQNAFSFSGWASSSSWIKLAHLEADGKEVKEGDVVARFDFKGTRALPRIREQVDRAKADKEKRALDLQSELRQLQNDLRTVEIDVEQRAVDVAKAGAISERSLSLFKQAHERAEFEAGALRKRIIVHRRKAASELAYLALKLERAQTDLKRYEQVKGRYEVRAPHGGVLRHGRHRRERRKIQKGDGMPSGYHFSSLAKDKSVSAEFFVPEARLKQVQIGDEVTVSLQGRGTWKATVNTVALFPQEIGFLRKNKELANAREKAYVVQATFIESPDGLTAGSEIKVEP